MQDFKLPAWTELPEIELYMDQVVSIIERALAPLPDGEGKSVTAAMINNYVKQKALPPPERKRYGPGHLAALFIICILKRVLNMAEIKNLLDFLRETRGWPEIYEAFRAELHGALTRVFSGGAAPAPVGDRALMALRACCGALAEKLLAQSLLPQEE